MRRLFDKESLSALIKLAAFLSVTGMCTFVLMLVLGNGSFADRNEYKALFTDVTGVAKGDDVRIAGVPVGVVDKVEVFERSQAVVTFRVDKDVPLTESTLATLKFRNLVGQRYMALSQGEDGGDARLEPGSTLGTDQTQEALDLNVLLNGFKPVFQALSPNDVNTFAFEIVQTLQGEAGSVEQLLSRTSSLTSTLADRDQLIGDTITNLSSVLGTIGNRDQELSDTIGTLQQFVTGLSDDRDAILNSIDSISELSVETAGLLSEARPALSADIKGLRALTDGLDEPENLAQIEESIKIFPHKLTKFGNAAASGSEFNFYLCDLNIELLLPGTEDGLDISGLPVNGGRCNQ